MYAGKAFHTREPAAEKLVSLKLMRVRGTTQTEAGCGQWTITHNWKRRWRWCWRDCVSSVSRNYLRFLPELPANETMTIGLITALPYDMQAKYTHWEWVTELVTSRYKRTLFRILMGTQVMSTEKFCKYLPQVILSYRVYPLWNIAPIYDIGSLS